MMNKPDYIWKDFGNSIIIWDLNKGSMSVTNGMEYVLNEINKQVPLVGKTVIYRDSEFIYNKIVINKKAEFQGLEMPANSNTMANVAKDILDDIYQSAS